MRLLAAAIVLLISGCYLVPQLKGAGVTLRAVTGAPYWVGVAIVSRSSRSTSASAACAA